MSRRAIVPMIVLAMAATFSTAASVANAVPLVHADVAGAPYTGLSIRAGAGQTSGPLGAAALEAPADAVNLAAYLANGFQVSGTDLAVRAVPPPGQDFVAGTTYPLTDATGVPGMAYAQLQAGDASSSADTSMVVSEFTRDGSGTITALAADITGPFATAQVRYNSSQPWSGVVIAPRVDLGFMLVAYPTHIDVPVTVVGTSAVTFGAATIGPDGSASADHSADFGVTDNFCLGQTIQPGQSCRMTVTATATIDGREDAMLTIADGSAVGSTRVSISVLGAYNSTGTYYPYGPERFWDTRTSGAKTPIGSGQTLTVAINGVGDLPLSGLSAVVVNLTVVSPTASGFLIAYASGTTRPAVSSINFAAGWTGANLVTVPIGADGQIAIYNRSGSTHAIVDVVGFYTSSDAYRYTGHPMGDQYQVLSPSRIWDGTMGSYTTADLVNTWNTASVPNADDNVAELALNVTAVAPSRSGFLTLWSGDGPRPGTSNVNFQAGEISPNMVIVPVRDVSAGVSFRIANRSGGTTRVLVDLVGVYTRNIGEGMRFRPVDPIRIMDTRGSSPIGLAGAFTARQTRTMPCPPSALTSDSWALVGNLTAVSPTALTFLTLWDGTTSRPGVSNINADIGLIRSNAASVPLSASYAFATYNHAGTVDVVLDVVGAFDQYPPASAYVDPGSFLTRNRPGAASWLSGGHLVSATVRR